MAFYIVKPEAIDKQDAIKKYIEANSFLTIKDTRIVMLNDNAFDNIFIDDRGSPLLRAIKAHLKHRRVAINLVSADCQCTDANVVEELIRITGDHYNPSLCSENTVRSCFGFKKFHIYHNQKYYLNAVHRTTLNESSAATDWVRKEYFTSR